MATTNAFNGFDFDFEDEPFQVLTSKSLLYGVPILPTSDKGMFRLECTSTVSETPQDLTPDVLQRMTGFLQTHQSVRMPRIVESELAVDASVTIEDWSGCRSPARAKRRERRGFRQRVRRYHPPIKGGLQIGDVIYMHPITAAEFRRLISEQTKQLERRIDNELYTGYLGGFGGFRF